MTPRYLTRKQVADRFGIHTNTLDRWAVLGTGPKRLIAPGGRTIRYAESDVDAWAAQHVA